MSVQTRIVESTEASRILSTLGAVLQSRSASKNIYWSPKIGTWVYVVLMPGGSYKITWQSNKNCGC